MLSSLLWVLAIVILVGIVYLLTREKKNKSEPPKEPPADE
jgi:cytochrome c-type biogenesis protein CcmH/NrfF